MRCAVILCACLLTNLPGSLKAQVPVWRLSPRADLTIGTVSGDEANTLNAVSAVLVLHDGRILVSERVGGRIKVFDNAGRFLTFWGRQGDGPGEFRLIRSMAAYRGDSVAVHDMAQAKITVLDDSGRYGRSVSLNIPWTRRAGEIPSQSCCMFVGALRDGSLIAASPAMIPTDPGPPRWDSQAFFRLPPDGAERDSLGAWPSTKYTYDPEAPNRIRDYHFSTRLTYAMHGDRLFIGNGSAYRIVVLERQGTALKQVGVIRGKRLPRPVTRQDRTLFEARIRREYAERPQRFEGPIETYLRGEFPETMPAFTRVVADEIGNLWVIIPPFAEQTPGPLTIDIFAPQGEPIGTLEVPPGLQLLVAGSGYAIFLERDSDGVEFVRRYRVLKN